MENIPPPLLKMRGLIQLTQTSVWWMGWADAPKYSTDQQSSRLSHIGPHLQSLLTSDNAPTYLNLQRLAHSRPLFSNSIALKTSELLQQVAKKHKIDQYDLMETTAQYSVKHQWWTIDDYVQYVEKPFKSRAPEKSMEFRFGSSAAAVVRDLPLKRVKEWSCRSPLV